MRISEFEGEVGLQDLSILLHDSPFLLSSLALDTTAKSLTWATEFIDTSRSHTRSGRYCRTLYVPRRRTTVVIYPLIDLSIEDTAQIERYTLCELALDRVSRRLILRANEALSISAGVVGGDVLAEITYGEIVAIERYKKIGRVADRRVDK